MATPTKAEIITKAQELYAQDQYRKGCPELAESSCEVSELKEDGYYSAAMSELMHTNKPRDYEIEWREYNKQTENLEKLKNECSSKILNMIPFDVQEVMNTGFTITGTSQSGKTNLAKHLVWVLICKGISVYVLDASQAWLHGTPISESIKIPNGKGEMAVNRRSTIIDISALTYGEKISFVNNFCKSIYQSHVNGFRYPEVIIFEEAQTYLPNGCMRSAKKYSNIIDLVTVGANYSLRFGLITQFPASVDKSPVKITQQRYFGWTTEKNDVDYVKSFIGKEHIEELKNLAKGEFIYQYKNWIQKFKCDQYGTSKDTRKDDGLSWNFTYNFP